MLAFIEKSLIAWADLARRCGIFLAAAFIAATIAAGFYAATHLKVNTDTSQMIDPSLPFQQRTAQLNNAFPEMKTDIIVIVRAPTLDEADAFTAELHARLSARDDAFTAVFTPAQEDFFRHNGLLYLRESELEARLTQMSKASSLIETLIKSPDVGTLFSTLAENDALAERSDLGKDTLQGLYSELADVVLASDAGERRPFSWLGALDEEGNSDAAQTQLLYASPVLDYTRLQPAKTGLNVLREEIAALNEAYGGRVETYITGDPALRVEELESVSTGIGLSFFLSFLLVSLLLYFAYRSGTIAALTMMSLLIALTLTSAFAARFVGELNLVSVAFTALLIGLGLDFAIHLLLHVQERRIGGENMAAALKGALHEVGPALALAAPTTALAFFSFIPTRFNGIAQLGIIAGVGVLIAFFVSVTFLPAALSLLKPTPAKPTTGRIRAGFDAVSKYSGPIAIVTIILGAASLVLMPQVRFDADQMSLRNPDSPSVKGFNLLFEDQSTVPYRLTRLVSSEEQARDTAARAAELETVSSTRSLPNFVPDNQDEKLELIDFAAGTLVFALDAEANSVEGPPASDGAARLRTRLSETYTDGAGARLAAALGELQASSDPDAYERLQQNIFAFWPQLVSRLQDQLQADYVDIDTLPEVLRSRYLSANNEWRVDILPAEDVRNDRALSTFVDEVAAVYPDLAGGAYQAKRAGEVISSSMLQATLIALGVVTVFLTLLIGRVRMVLLILFPLALAAVLTSATGVLLNIPFNYANVIVLPLLIGIGVDSGIHLVMRHDQVAAGEGVYGTSTPRAVLFSALTTLASFGSLMLSPHRGTASMGELLTIAIAFTLVCTLIVLPAAFDFQERQIRKATQNIAKK